MPIPSFQIWSTLPVLVQSSQSTFFVGEYKYDYYKASALHVGSVYIDIFCLVQYKHLLSYEYHMCAVRCSASLICHSSKMKTISI